ncbi:MAG: NAD(P)H-dependent glycerol-3-phosphate dehydrogenase [Synechocystis sp.]
MSLTNSTLSAIVTVLGGGAWGSALARLLIANHNQTHIWSRHGTEDLATLLQGTEIIVSAISMKGVPSVVQRVQAITLKESVILVTATKGLDPQTTATPSQIWQQTFPKNPVVVLSGPNLSKEIAQGLPAATVVASNNAQAAQRVQKIFASENFRVYTNQDPLGTELGGTLKNVMAIAVGVCDGLGLGTNAKSALITRALPEITRVGLHFGAQPDTFWGLAGLGDMLATCSSMLSRNYRVGYGLAQGKPLDEILAALDGTAEGVNTTDVLVHIADREKIPVPIAHQVHRLLHGKITPMEAVEALMDRDLKPEFSDFEGR